MYIPGFLAGALLVATASSAPSSHAGKTKTTGNYAVSHEEIFTKADVDNADDLAAPRALYITAMTFLKSVPISPSPTAPQGFQRTSTANIHLTAGSA
jgi:hypothetical protein